MLTIDAVTQGTNVGLTRRALLRVGAIGSIGLTWPELLRAGQLKAVSAPGSSFGRAKRCILLFPVGGPPQHDTFDPKPDAPEQYRGEFRPIETNVPGIRICELFPRLARLADTYCLVRSVTHRDSVHTSAGYTMLTGAVHPKSNDPLGSAAARPTPDDHPHPGAILAKVRKPERGLPLAVSIPELVRDAGVNEMPGQKAGFLGQQYSPFRLDADVAKGAFPIPNILMPIGMTAARLGDRQSLLRQLDGSLHAAEARFALMDDFYRQAFSMIGSSATREAFDLNHEPAAAREAYGPHLFGQGCLLARRLVEAGVTLVTVYWHYEGPKDSPCWDTHAKNFPHMRDRLAPPADRALSALLSDLSGRGLLDETLVLWVGEFGRSPRVNAQGGRDHWPHVQSVLMAGGGVRGGSVYGSSDRLGAYPAESPVSPGELTATLLHLLGVRHDMELHDTLARPLRATDGEPLHALFA